MQVRKTFSKLNQDLSKYKYPEDVYYDAKDIRIIGSGNDAGITNIKNKALAFNYPNIESNTTGKTHLDSLLTFPLSPTKSLGEVEVNNTLYSIVQYGNQLGTFPAGDVTNVDVSIIPFLTGENINDGTNTETLDSQSYPTLNFTNVTNPFTVGQTLTGQSSGAIGRVKTASYNTLIYTSYDVSTYGMPATELVIGNYIGDGPSNTTNVGTITNAYAFGLPSAQTLLLEVTMTAGTFSNGDTLYWQTSAGGGTGIFAATSIGGGSITITSSPLLNGTVTLEEFAVTNNVDGLTSTNGGVVDTIDGYTLGITLDVASANFIEGEELQVGGFTYGAIERVVATSYTEDLSEYSNTYPIAIIQTTFGFDVNNNKTYTNTLLFLDVIDCAVDKKYDVVGLYENQNIIKIYWTDLSFPLKFANVADSNLLTKPREVLDTTPLSILTTPKVIGFNSGGLHTSGAIQYAYNLYNLNGAQTKLSPLSGLVYLNNGDVGNTVGTNITKSPTVSISNIDTKYDRIRVYSVKYTSKDATPEVKLIYDGDTENSITFTDTNNTTISNISFVEFVLLGGETYIPEHLIIKDNRLILGKYAVKQKNVDFDLRAYSFDNSGIARLEEQEGSYYLLYKAGTTRSGAGGSANEGDWELFTAGGSYTGTNGTEWSIPLSADCINPSVKADIGDSYYEDYIHQLAGTKTGATGKNMEITLEIEEENSDIAGINSTMDSDASLAENGGILLNNTNRTSLKTGEIYRFFGEFLFDDGSWSFPTWITDIKIPIIGEYFNNATTCTPFDMGEEKLYYIYAKAKLINTPDDKRIVGWRTSIVERTEGSKAVYTQGLATASISDEAASEVDNIPSYLQRGYYNTGVSFAYSAATDELIKPVIPINSGSTTNLSDTNKDGEILHTSGAYDVDTTVITINSPETILYDKLPASSGKIRKLGYLRNVYSTTARQTLDDAGEEINTIFDPADGTTPVTDASYNGRTLNTGAQLHTGFNVGNASHDYYIGHLIGDNRDKSGAVVVDSFDRRKFVFTRYYGGIDVYSTNKQSRVIDEYIDILRPTDNIKKVKAGGVSTYLMSGNPKIAIKYNSTNYNYFSYKTGTSIVFTNGTSLITPSAAEQSAMNGIGTTPAVPYHFSPFVEIYDYGVVQYGGNSYEARQLNKTIPYSNVVTLASNTTTTEHYGDTFLQKFNCLRTYMGETTTTQIAEIISFPVETNINLDLRYDLLKNAYTNYDSEEPTSYGFNLVYNQLNNTIINTAKPSNFTELTNFNLSLIPSKIKTNGELIDSFTEFLINDKKDLNGIYGDITSLKLYKDNLFAFQPRAIAYVAVNPRVQISGGDGIPILLGAGNIIERYDYITTNSGTCNRDSIVNTRNGLMYVDIDNASINFLNPSQGEYKLTDVAGLHFFLEGYIRKYYEEFKGENTILGNRISTFHDNINNETLFTFNNGVENYTIVYNGLQQGFTSFYSNTPKYYIKFNNGVYSTTDRLNISEHYIGDYTDDFYITFIVSEQPHLNKVFNNLHFNSKFLDTTSSDGYVDSSVLQTSDLNDVTFNTFSFYNDYQRADNKLVDVEAYRSSGKRRLRKWNFIIPRQDNTRNRFNSQWLAIKMLFDKTQLSATHNSKNIKGMLDDVLISFTPT